MDVYRVAGVPVQFLVSGPYGVGFWKNISRGWPSISSYIMYDVGDGSRVKFWQDHW